MSEIKELTCGQKVIEIATGYVGQKESPSNWGPFVQACLLTVGITYPAPWCMSYAFRCFLEASKALGVDNPIPKTGGCINAWNQAKNKLPKSKLTPSSFKPGSILIFDHGGGLGHAAIGVSCDANGLIHTIEGNSSLAGSRNGDGVYALSRRHIDDKELLGIIY